MIGGRGFVGSSLVPLFVKDGFAVRVGDIRSGTGDPEVVEVDVRNADSLLQLGGADTIVNLAAVHRDDVRPASAYGDVNIGGAETTCDYARKIGASRIVFTSSVAVYGFAPPDTSEAGDISYFNEYGRTKHIAEKVYADWQAEDPLNRCLVIVRPTVIFGPGNRGNVYNLLRQIANGWFAMFGDGRNVKSMAYVENVAKF